MNKQHQKNKSTLKITLNHAETHYATRANRANRALNINQTKNKQSKHKQNGIRKLIYYHLVICHRASYH